MNATSTFFPLPEDDLTLLNSTIASITSFILSIPGSNIALRYLKNSYHDDPFRVVLELFLVFFAVQYMFGKKYKIDDNAVKLTAKEIDELVAEWQPEPLVPSLTPQAAEDLSKIPTIIGPQSTRPRLSNKKSLLNMATSNFLGLVSNEEIKEKAIETLRVYGVGSCGPPGFYGTIDVHMKLEKDIAAFLGVEEAIIYAQGFSTISSVIPAFSKRGDVIVMDDGINFATQKGVLISRSIIRKFRHNDMDDLERVLEDIRVEELVGKKRLTRKFIVTEGLFQNYGDIVPLPKVIELKKKYKYRLILDESCSIGVLGPRGAGTTDHFGIPSTEVDMIVGSLATTLCSAGGFCAGTREIIDHQRLSGSAYCFSASMPAMLAVAGSEGLAILSREPGLLVELRDRARTLRAALSHPSLEKLIEISSDPASPFLHLRVRQSYISARLRHDEPGLPRDEEKHLLQEVVDDCAAQGVLLTRAKYVAAQEMNPPRPSVKVCLSSAMTRKDVEKAGGVIKAALVKVLGKWRK